MLKDIGMFTCISLFWLSAVVLIYAVLRYFFQKSSARYSQLGLIGVAASFVLMHIWVVALDGGQPIPEVFRTIGAMISLGFLFITMGTTYSVDFTMPILTTLAVLFGFNMRNAME